MNIFVIFLYNAKQVMGVWLINSLCSALWSYSLPDELPHHCSEPSRWQCFARARAPTVSFDFSLFQNTFYLSCSSDIQLIKFNCCPKEQLSVHDIGQNTKKPNNVSTHTWTFESHSTYLFRAVNVFSNCDREGGRTSTLPAVCLMPSISNIPR